MSSFLRLDKKDFIKGLINAVFSGATMAVMALIGGVGFDLFTADWKNILSLVIAGAVAGGVGYLQKNLFTDDQGKVLGVKIG